MLKPAAGTSAPKREPVMVAVNIINLCDTTGGSAISLFLFFKASGLTALLKTIVSFLVGWNGHFDSLPGPCVCMAWLPQRACFIAAACPLFPPPEVLGSL